MKTHGYLRKLRLLIIGSVALLILGIIAYTRLGVHENITRLPIHRTENVEKGTETALMNVSLSGAENISRHEIILRGPMMKDVKIRPGDTIFKILDRENINGDEASSGIAALTEVYNPRNLRSGQEITLVFEDPDFIVFQGMRIKIDDENEVLVEKKTDGRFTAVISRKKLTMDVRRVDGRIETSLYDSAVKAGLPLSILYDLIYAYSFDIDFQRDIRSGDEYSLAYETFRDSEGNVVRNGEIRYAELTVFGIKRTIYRYEDIFGDQDFYDGEGKSIRKQLLRTPLDVPRLTSGYGLRQHPVYGFSKVHRGLDFGAPQGTPIRAAGDGVLSSMMYNDTYGNHIIINHPNQYSTLYAHMVSFKRGLKRGDRVKQGQIIGYVGSTGLSTGSHLHYEVRFRGGQVNPASLKFPPGKKLGGLDLTRFRIRKGELDRMYRELGPEFVLTGDPGGQSGRNPM